MYAAYLEPFIVYVCRIMFMRPVKASSKPRQKAATTKYEPVWVTCDDLAAEGILVGLS